MLAQSSYSSETQSATSVSEPTTPNYAFLVHSQNTLTQNLPPKVDNKMLARQKRRRTSPEDQAVLETEYQKNSKPDKTARAEIVSKVALGEKEVQIWFQNRRQNDRRKSRPLMPHEMISHLRNSPLSADFRPLSTEQSNVDSQQQDSTTHQVSLPNSQDFPPPFVQPSATEERVPSRASSIHDLLNPSPEEEIHQNSDRSERFLPTKANREENRDKNKDREPFSRNVSFITTASQSTTASSQETEDSSPQSSQSRKRSFNELSEDNTDGQKRLVVSAPSLHASEHPANVRLSISMDGSVKVRTSSEETPSPPKDRILPAGLPVSKLHESKSAVLPNRLQGDKAHGRTGAASGAFGRSRDSRTWEFYCDSEARESLAMQAERERSGSAASAISLIRSQSQSKRHSIEGQRKALTLKASVGHSKTNGPLHGKPKLARAMSSLGRIQGHGEAKGSKSLGEAISKAKRGSVYPHRRSPSSDSDKENWAPGTRASVNPLRRHHSMKTKSRAVLGEHRHVPRQSLDRDAEPKRGRMRGDGPVLGLEQKNPVVPADCDDEVAAFMSGERGDEEEDLDCVQGLLSLSQGAWR